MRAIETGRTMLRATNTGMTAIVDPHGESSRACRSSSKEFCRRSAGLLGRDPVRQMGNPPTVVACFALLAHCCLYRRRTLRAAEKSR